MQRAVSGVFSRLPGQAGDVVRAATLRGQGAVKSLALGLTGQTSLGEGVKAAYLGRTTNNAPMGA